MGNLYVVSVWLSIAYANLSSISQYILQQFPAGNAYVASLLYFTIVILEIYNILNQLLYFKTAQIYKATVYNYFRHQIPHSLQGLIQLVSHI